MMVDTDNRRSKDGLVGIDDRFKMSRIDVVTATNNDTFETLSEVDEAVVTEITDITSMEPEFTVVVEADSLGGFGVITEITHHY